MIEMDAEDLRRLLALVCAAVLVAPFAAPVLATSVLMRRAIRRWRTHGPNTA